MAAGARAGGLSPGRGEIFDEVPLFLITDRVPCRLPVVLEKKPRGHVW